MFSKSKTKRFQDPVPSGPAPGQYDVRDLKSSAKGIVFEKDKRWKDPNLEGGIPSYSSMENLSGSWGKSLVPIHQSTCAKKRPTNNNKRRTCFVSNSASDLTSRFALEADVEFQTDKIRDLQAKIMQLEAEICKLKASKGPNNEFPQLMDMDMEEIINEKLVVELEKRKLEESLKDLKAEESLRSKELIESINEMKKSFTNVVNEINNRYNSLEKAFDEICNDYQRRLERAKSLLEKMSMINSVNVANFENLKKDYDILVEEQCIKDDFIEEQVRKVAECTDLVCQLSSQLKLKGDTCDDLNMQLAKTYEEGEKEKVSFAVKKENILKQLISLEAIHEKALKDTSDELVSTKTLNMEYRQQIENIELSMTENIREISKKYECLEETFDKTQKYYEKRLERSNSLVQKTIIANHKCNEEFESLQKMYAELQYDLGNLTNECDSKDELLIKANKKLEEYENNAHILLNQLTEKDGKMTEIESGIKEITAQSSEKDIKIEEYEGRISEMLIQLGEKEQKLDEYGSNNKQLELQLIEKNLKIGELENNVKAIMTEIDVKKKEIEEYVDNTNVMVEKLREKDDRIAEFESNAILMSKQLDENNVKLGEYKALQKSFACHVEERDTKIVEFESSMKLISEQLEAAEKSLVDKDQKICGYEDDMKILAEQLEAAKNSNIDEEEFNNLHKRLTEAESCSEEWRLKFEELEKKVGPFMDQLEQFQLEKKSLLDQNSLTQQEMKKLSEKYGQILGHQNNKQKIRHISKLKDENFQLKAEVMKLRTNASKDKVRISQLESKTQEGKRFDPAKSFSHGKENRDALRTVNS